MSEKKRISFRITQDLEQQIAAYATSADLDKTHAILNLLRTGLAVKNDGIYVSELAKITRETIRTELNAFARILEEQQENFYEDINTKVDEATAASFASLLASTEHIDGDKEATTTLLQVAGYYMLYGLGRGEAIKAATKHRHQESNERDFLISSSWD